MGMVAMKVRDLVGQLDLGNSVAEFDDSLERHFVETESFRALVSGRYDVIAGDKGTGKTALYRSLLKRYREIPELARVEVITAFNPSGNPVFQRLTQIPPLLEGQCITVWKAFFLSLVGNWLLEVFHDAPTEALRELDKLLIHVGLRSRDESAATIFSKVVSTFSRLTQPKSAEVGFTLSDAGLPVITPKVEFGEATKAQGPRDVIPHEQALALLNRALDDLDTVVWIVMDRLDEAFQGYPETERPALRALLRTYLDLLEFPRLRLKLFVRKDLFRKIVQGGFVNLTHVNARRLDIVWDEEDLRNLLCRRIRGSEALASALTLSNATDSTTFDALFPAQIDAGPRKPSTWNWMMSRIRDGNNVKPPRNLIDLTKKAQQAQLRSEDRSPRDFAAGIKLIEADAIRRALTKLSEDRVQDTLLAEAADFAPLIERFRDGKAEHNPRSLAALLDVPETEVRIKAKPLVDLGFLEEIGESFKVPMIYRDGLSITQGKAFAPDQVDDEDADA